MQTADHELSDSEIEERFGGLFREFHEAMNLDPWLMVRMVERIADNRRVNALKAERRDGGRTETQASRRREERNAHIRTLRGEGLSKRQIAECIGVSASTVWGVLHEADTPA